MQILLQLDVVRTYLCCRGRQTEREEKYRKTHFIGGMGNCASYNVVSILDVASAVLCEIQRLVSSPNLQMSPSFPLFSSSFFLFVPEEKATCENSQGSFS